MSNLIAAAASRLSLMANVLLAGIKILVGIVGSSYALIADGIESLADVVSSLIVWNGLRVGSREPDREHPYGHGKAEAIATLLAGLGLWVSGALIATQAIREIQTDHQPPAFFTLPVLLGIIAFKEFLYRYLLRLGQRLDSGALRAEAFHHRSDSLTSLCVLVGLIIAVFAGPDYAIADDVAALLVTGLIFFNGFNIMRPAIDELMDRRIFGERYVCVMEAIRNTPGVIDVETLWIRRSGRAFHIDVHLEVDADISVREGHRIAHQVKDNLMALETIEIIHVGTHVEPHAD